MCRLWVTDEKPPPHEAPTSPRQGPGEYLKQENELREPLDGLHHQPVERDAVGATHLPPLLGTRWGHSLTSCSEAPAPRGADAAWPGRLSPGPGLCSASGLREEPGGVSGSAARAPCHHKGPSTAPHPGVTRAIMLSLWTKSITGKFSNLRQRPDLRKQPRQTFLHVN